MDKQTRTLFVVTLFGVALIVLFFVNIGSNPISLHILETYLLYFALLGLYALAFAVEISVIKMFSDITFKPLDMLNKSCHDAGRNVLGSSIFFTFLLVWVTGWGTWGVNLSQSLKAMNWEACDAVVTHFPQSLLNERLLRRCEPTESLATIVVSDSRDINGSANNLVLAFRGTSVQLDTFTATFELTSSAVAVLLGGDIALILFALFKGILALP